MKSSIVSTFWSNDSVVRSRTFVRTNGDLPRLYIPCGLTAFLIRRPFSRHGCRLGAPEMLELVGFRLPAHRVRDARIGKTTSESIPMFFASVSRSHPAIADQDA